MAAWSEIRGLGWITVPASDAQLWPSCDFMDVCHGCVSVEVGGSSMVVCVASVPLCSWIDFTPAHEVLSNSAVKLLASSSTSCLNTWMLDQ